MQSWPKLAKLAKNGLEFGKSSLLCCTGYRNAIFKFLFYESQVEYQRKAFTKEKKI